MIRHGDREPLEPYDHLSVAHPAEWPAEPHPEYAAVPAAPNSSTTPPANALEATAVHATHPGAPTATGLSSTPSGPPC